MRTGLKEGYSVDIVLIIAQRGAPNSADCPLYYATAAQRTPLHRAMGSLCAEKRRSSGFGGSEVRIIPGQLGHSSYEGLAFAALYDGYVPAYR